MINSKITRYKGECRIDGRRYFWCKASADDAQEIAALYKSIKIDCKNCTERLDPGNKNNFAQKGGMFIVPDKSEIEEEIRDDRNFRAVFRDEKGCLAGSLWFSENNEAYNGLVYGKMINAVYPREILVSPEYGSKHIAKVMYYTVIRVMRKIGYTRGAADLYRVLGFKTNHYGRAVDLINVPSMRCITAIGAEFERSLNLKEVFSEDLSVIIEPQLYLFDFDKIIMRCEKLFEEKSIKITWDEI